MSADPAAQSTPEPANASWIDAFIDGMRAASTGRDRYPPPHFTSGTHEQWFAGYDLEVADARN